MSGPVPDPIGLVRRRLAGHQAIEIEDPAASRAAVALVLAREPAPAVLLVRRKERAGDPWSGHMALPGGYSSTSDTSLLVTAIRETREETGIDLGGIGELLGALDDVAPRSPLLPLVVVRPFVFAVGPATPGNATHEVDEVIWLTLDELFDAANQRPLTFDFPSGSRTFDSIQVRGYTIWGLTERILSQLRAVIQS